MSVGRQRRLFWPCSSLSLLHLQMSWVYCNLHCIHAATSRSPSPGPATLPADPPEQAVKDINRWAKSRDKNRKKLFHLPRAVVCVKNLCGLT